MKHICIVCPCYNESEVLRPFLAELSRVCTPLEQYSWEFVCVDDGSRDDTLVQLLALSADEPRLTVVSLSRNFGHQIALTAGLDKARGDAIICMDSDLQHPPELIPQMVELWERGNDIVSCIRSSTQDEGILKKVTSKGFYRLLNYLSDTHIPSGSADFFLASKKVHRSLCNLPERHRFLRGLVSWVGYRRAYLEYCAPARFAGKSKYTLRRMISLASDATFSFSTYPIRLMVRFGLLIILAGMAYLLYILGRAFVVGDLVPGWASTLGAFLILGGAQMLSLGILGQYVGRIYEESKRRPLYLVKLGRRCSMRRRRAPQRQPKVVPL